MSSAFPGFYKLTIEQRQAELKKLFNFTDDEIAVINGQEGSMSLKTANSVIENVVAMHSMPVGVATNFIIDGKDVIIPMANEEPSVIAGASNAAKVARLGGGFVTACGQNICSGQIILIPPEDEKDPVSKIKEFSDNIITVANETMPSMVSRSGGVTELEVRTIDTNSGTMVIVEIHINVCDAMGANCVNHACEKVKAYIANALGYEPLMGILTNNSKHRLVHATAKFPASALRTKDMSGLEVAQRIVMATDLAKADPNRAATHRKGIMNGITAVVLATGNDTRAVEAAVHAFAMEAKNPALTDYFIDDAQNLVGSIYLPVPVGTVGGSMKRDPANGVFKKMLRAETANDLARAIAAVGLASNFAALRALVTAGICAGHMRLHSRNIAAEAGADGDRIERISEALVRSGEITVSNARRILSECTLV